jgi:hypothetical protein
MPSVSEVAMPFRILAQGVTFWFELPPDQTQSAHFALGFVNCSHLSLEGATLARDAASLANAVAENPRWQNDGWEIRNCDCRFTRIGSGICRRIRIEGNVFDDMAIHPDGVTLQAGFQSLNHSASTPLLSDVATPSTFASCPAERFPATPSPPSRHRAALRGS